MLADKSKDREIETYPQNDAL